MDPTDPTIRIFARRAPHFQFPTEISGSSTSPPFNISVS